MPAPAPTIITMEVNIPTTVAGSPSGISTVSNLTSTVNGGEQPRNPAGPATDEPGVPTRPLCSLSETIAALNREDEEGGDGGYSDVEGEEVELHGGKSLEIKEKDDGLEDAIVPDKDGDVKGMLKVTATGTTNFIGEIGENGSNLNLISNITLPKPPDDFVVPPLRSDEPAFNVVDNPGDWDRYYFQPKRTKSNKYAGHFLPTGATPVPLGDDGKRKCGSWEFHYKGFDNGNSTSYRRGATTSNLFPKEMLGELDADILERLGLSENRMKEVDPLFFFQLLLPLCDTAKSGIANDPRRSYYTELSKFTNSYAYLQGQGSDYGHVWKNTTAAEILHFDGVLFHDGTLGGSNGALYRRWDKTNDCYSKIIAESMTITRHNELKRNLKLCNNSEVAKRGQPGYDPGKKYDLVWKCIVDNTNAISKKADETQVIDESTWGHAGFGEKGTGITGRLRNKKVAKGGQTVLMMDRHRFRIRAYMHRNKIYNEIYKSDKTREWSANGPYELKHLADELNKMVDGSEGNKKKLFRNKPCITADNFFQNDRIMEYLGEMGFGGIMTSARNSLPKDIKSHYLHKEKTDPKNKQAKVARFAQPIVAVKNVPGSHQRIHVSFQSTSSCNISTVNALNEIENFCELRERGRGNNKRHWVIEMNHARRIYLSSYNGIDVLDHLIKNARLFYQTWKYWHSPKNHALAIALTCAYDIYLECTEGNLKTEWKVEKPVSFWEFQSKLGKQALTYVPKKCKYPGDELLRSSTVIPRVKRAAEMSSEGNVSRTQLQIMTEDDRSRACGDLDKMCRHVDSIIRLPKGRACAYCGEKAYHACGICKDESGKPVALHVNTRKSKGCMEMCYFYYHNDNHIGLAKEDQISFRKRKRSDWEPPTSKEREENREIINTLKDRFR